MVEIISKNFMKFVYGTEKSSMYVYKALFFFQRNIFKN